MLFILAITPPACEPKCGKNAHCEYGLLNQCVCNPGTNGNPYEGCEQELKKTCATISCGRSAECHESYNNAECVCPSGFAGNPNYECKDIDECANNACGENAVCINTIGSYDCRCKQGYTGNPFSICSKVQVGVCEDYKSCDCNSQVLCPNGYTCKNGKCKNLCGNVKCGPRAGCDGGKCVCPPGYIGNPNDLKLGCKIRGECNNDADCANSEICFQLGKGLRKCVDACGKIQCGPNALCLADDHRSSCICASGYYGNAGDLNVGCQPEERLNNKECIRDKDCRKGYICAVDETGNPKCVNPCQNVACGLHETCRVDEHGQATCTCKSEFLWNPISSSCEKPSVPDCTSDLDCPTASACHPDALGVLKCTSVCSQFTCPPNSVCVASQHKGHCQCTEGYTGNPNDRNGCRPILQNQCNSDAQCTEQDTCRKDATTGILMCRPACESISCGPHAICIVNNHVPQCQCPPGPYAGDPNDPIVGCKTVPCVYNIDCPSNQLCNRLTHICYDVCEEESCGDNAVCISENHKATCQCPPGFKANPIPEVECVQVDSCKPNPCHPSAVCEMNFSGHTCKCPPNHIGDPYTSGCRPEGNCPNGNNDCPPQSTCISGKCINPCEQSRCGPNAICNVVNRKAVCNCPAKFIPGPRGPQEGCIRISTACSTDLDCGNEVCFNGQCKSVCRNNEDCLSGER